MDFGLLAIIMKNYILGVLARIYNNFPNLTKIAKFKVLFKD